jgi:hypothetical protein
VACAIAEAMLDKEAHLDVRRTLASGAQLLGQDDAPLNFLPLVSAGKMFPKTCTFFPE